MSTFKDSDFLIHGTRAAFTSELPLFTTTRGILLPRDYSGRQFRVAAGGLTGRAPTVARDSARSHFPTIVLICLPRIAASACSAIDELLAVEFQYSLRLIKLPLIRMRVWGRCNATGPHHRRVQYQSAAWRAFGKVSRYPSRDKAYLQMRSRWPRSRAIRGNP